MLTLDHYEAPELLYGGHRTLVVRLRRRGGGTAIAKCLRDPTPSRQDVEALRREFACMRRFDCDQIVRAHELTDSNLGPVLVMEDFGGASLHQEMQRRGEPLELPRALHLIARVCEALGVVHDAGLVHRDIKPHNIVVNHATGRVALSDFGLAAPPTAAPLTELIGTPPYLSPEQTGRIARGVDARSDLYSLGVTFYQLCTGELPFPGDDLLELVHCAIARQPPAPHLVDRRVPPVVSQIILKLLAKDPERRYQSARGLRADLLRCLAALAGGGELAAFPLGEDDVSETFVISEALVGRDDVVAALEAARAGLVVVHGPAGSGRSALVRPLLHAAAARGATLARAAGDAELARVSPHAALWQPLRELVRQRLADDEAAARRFLARVVAALGDNLGLALTRVPELIGRVEPPRHDPRDTAPGEVDRLLRRAAAALFRVCAEDTPLVVFVDDAHAVGPAFLEVVETALIDDHAARTAWILTCPDGHLDADAALGQLMARVEALGVPARAVALPPLSAADVERLVRDSLRPAVDDAAGLAALLARRSLGRPRGVLDLLRSLRGAGLRFDHATRAWRWDREAVLSASLADDVLDELRARAAALPPDARALLALAGCVGRVVDLAALEAVDGRPAPALRDALAPACETGLLREDGAHLVFADPRLAAAVTADLPPARRAAAHRALGRRMLEKTGPSAQDLFAMYEHFARAREALTDRGERLQVAEALLAAGRAALDGGAHAYAIEILERAIHLLPGDPWRSAPELTSALHRACMEAEYLGGRVPAGLARFEPLLAAARDELTALDLFILRMDLESLSLGMAHAFATGRRALQRFGVETPERAGPARIAVEFARARWALRGVSPDDIAAMPVATDARALRIHELIRRLTSAAYNIDPTWLIVLMLRLIREIPRTGHVTPAASEGFVWYGAMLVGLFDDIAGAAVYDDLSRRLQARPDSARNALRVPTLRGWFLAPWLRPWREATREILAGARPDESPDQVAALYGCQAVASAMLAGSEDLARIRAFIADNRGAVRRGLTADMADCFTIEQQQCLALCGETHAPDALDGPQWSEREFLAVLDQRPLARVARVRARALLAVLADDPTAARPFVDEALAHKDVLFASAVLVDIHMLAVLTYAGLLRDAGLLAAPPLRRRAERSLARIELAARHNEANFAARLWLARGALARGEGRHGDALAAFNRAIELARRHGNLHIDAMANEQAARVCFASASDAVGATYLHAALRAFDRWGARGQVARLERAFAAKIAGVDARTGARSSSASSGSSGSRARGAELDLASTLKATRAISGEIALDRLLRALAAVVMENAGARRVVVALAGDGGLRVEADMRLDGPAAAITGGVPLADYPGVPQRLLAHVARTREPVVLRDAAGAGPFVTDPDIAARRPRSLLCAPIVSKGELVGLIHLEHDQATDVFTPARLDLIQHVAAQLAVSVENARLYATLEVARAAAVAADRTKTGFLMRMSHELRTPLNAVIGYTELIDEQLDDGDTATVRDDLQRIRAAANRLLRTLSNILELSRVEAGGARLHPASIDVAAFAQALAAEHTEPARAQGNALTVAVAPDVGPLVSDPGKLHACLASLLDNACRFTRSGHVALRVESAPLRGAPAVRFVVADTGIGIAEPDLARLFRPFSQVDDSTTRRYEGAGVGLAVTRLFCDILGAELSVASQPGHGSTFAIAVPSTPPRP